MNIDNSSINKYILINTKLKPVYAKISVASLTSREAQIKNNAFRMNRVNKKYVLEKDWR